MIFREVLKIEKDEKKCQTIKIPATKMSYIKDLNDRKELLKKLQNERLKVTKLFDFLKRYKTVQSLTTLKIIIKITLKRLHARFFEFVLNAGLDCASL